MCNNSEQGQPQFIKYFKRQAAKKQRLIDLRVSFLSSSERLRRSVESALQENGVFDELKSVVEKQEQGQPNAAATLNQARTALMRYVMSGVLENIVFSAQVRTLRGKDSTLMRTLHTMLMENMPMDVVEKVARRLGYGEDIIKDISSNLKRRSFITFANIADDQKSFCMSIKNSIESQMDKAYKNLLKGDREQARKAFDNLSEEYGSDTVKKVITAVGEALETVTRDRDNKQNLAVELDKVAGQYYEAINQSATHAGFQTKNNSSVSIDIFKKKLRVRGIELIKKYDQLCSLPVNETAEKEAVSAAGTQQKQKEKQKETEQRGDAISLGATTKKELEDALLWIKKVSGRSSDLRLAIELAWAEGKSWEQKEKISLIITFLRRRGEEGGKDSGEEMYKNLSPVDDDPGPISFVMGPGR